MCTNTNICSKGYGIVYSNPRGSGGYGLIFWEEISTISTGPASDTLTALDKTVQEGCRSIYSLVVLMQVTWPHGLSVMSIASKQHVRNEVFMIWILGEGNAWRLVPNYFGYPHKRDLHVNLYKLRSKYCATPFLSFFSWR
jgi:hypothetical protein